LLIGQLLLNVLFWVRVGGDWQSNAIFVDGGSIYHSPPPSLPDRPPGLLPFGPIDHDNLRRLKQSGKTSSSSDLDAVAEHSSIGLYLSLQSLVVLALFGRLIGYFRGFRAGAHGRRGSFSNVLNTMFGSFQMGVYADLGPSGFVSVSSRWQIVVVYELFMLIVQLVLLNLLIAIMGDTCTDLALAAAFFPLSN
jgi:hypothetical protein